MNLKTTMVKLAMILAAVSLLVLSIPVPVLAAPSIGLSVSSDPPGTSVTVSGSGFTSGESYQIIFAPGTAYQQTLFSGGMVSGTGTFSTPVTIPYVPFDQYVIRVSAITSGTLMENFNVTAGINLNNSSGYVSDTLLVSGAGFRPSVPVFVFFNNASSANSTADTRGVISPVSFPVPTLHAGVYYVYATDGDASTPAITFTLKPRLRTDISQGAVGDKVDLDGTGFDYISGITVYWDNEPVPTPLVFSSSTGVFLTSIVVPPTTRGSHNIKARDNNQNAASASFEVTSSITVNPNSAGPGSTVSLVGRGFRASYVVSVNFNGTAIKTQPTTITTDTTGSFSASFEVPGVVAGNYLVRASYDAYLATATLMVASSIALSPPSGNVGTEVMVNGTGFSPGGSAVLSYDSQTLATISADSAGGFSASFSVPASMAGQHTVSAREPAIPGVVATATFIMESNPPPAPVLLSPADDCQAETQPTFTWSVVSDPSGVVYELQVARDSGFSGLVLSKPELPQTSYQLSQTEKLELTKIASPYYWRIRAVDGAGNASDWASPYSLYTEDSTPPQVPVLRNPADGSQKSGGVSFDWADVPDPQGVSYALQVAQDAAFSRIVVSKEGLSESGYRLTSAEKLSPSTGDPSSPYYWRVRATDGAGNQSDWSDANAFSVGESLQGAALYAVAAIAGVMLVLIGIFAGMRIRPVSKPKA